jgi:hypothetical protein
MLLSLPQSFVANKQITELSQVFPKLATLGGESALRCMVRGNAAIFIALSRL